jgi:hypothetical protein
MKYSVEIEIGLPRDRVIELFDNTDNLPKWQPSLLSFEALSGDPGQKGAKSKMRYKMGRKEVEMVETITDNRFPEALTATYEANGVWNEVVNRFDETPRGTKWTMESEFQCQGVMRVISFLMPGVFKKESLKQMRNFKAFAEAA